MRMPAMQVLRLGKLYNFVTIDNSLLENDIVQNVVINGKVI